MSRVCFIAGRTCECVTQNLFDSPEHALSDDGTVYILKDKDESDGGRGVAQVFSINLLRDMKASIVRVNYAGTIVCETHKSYRSCQHMAIVKEYVCFFKT